jgi:Fic family protein
MNPAFKHFDLILSQPSFDHVLTDLIIELDYLRKKELGGSTHPKIFFQLKNLFHTLESIGSARIEGNRTTIAEFIETKIEPHKIVDEGIQEIINMEKGMDFIDHHVKDYPINRAFISELHKRVVDGLSPSKEGDANPGQYRSVNVKINRAVHLPPDVSQVTSYMDELFKFINHNDGPKYDLLKTAIAHHRFVWIHPFRNGNGRTVRLFTYAMLVKQGFNIDRGRIVNPTAIFCHDRQKYFDNLSVADKGDAASILSWCEYVLFGLKREIEKVDRLLNYAYLKEKILLPTIDISLERKLITDVEAKILKVAAQKQVFQAGDLKTILPGKLPAEISRIIRRLRTKKMIIPEEKDARKYLLSFQSNYLLRGVIHTLGDNGFLPVKDPSPA